MTAFQKLDAAAAAGKLTPDAAAAIRRWLVEPRYAAYAAEVGRQIDAGLWKELDDAFWTTIPFGTGGRRGKMYPIGSNAINDRTIGESAQGIADYVDDFVKAARGGGDAELRSAVAYDTRHQSRHFAELCSEIMAAAGFRVYFLDGVRSTPELSFAVRHFECDCGLMITASHNPPSDNAVKVYWSSGGQVLPPHDAGIIERVMSVGEIQRLPFAEAVAAGRIEFCQAEADAAYLAAVRRQALPGPRELRIVYSPLHGVGGSSVLPVLQADGFSQVELFELHAQPNGDFPNVPGHVANPENPTIFEAIVARGQAIGADLALATDPDADRLGCAAPIAFGSKTWQTLNGNQIGALLTDFVLDARRRAGRLSPEHYVVKTLVTTEMIRRIADYYGVRTLGNLQVGFKYIGQAIDEAGADRFAIGCEESHGYLVGDHVRDKDATVAAMLLADLAAQLRAKRQTLHQRLDALYWQFGYHAEQQMSLALPGSQGMRQIQTLMARFRADPPPQLGEYTIRRARDYQSLTVRTPGNPPQPLEGPRGDMVMLDLENPRTPARSVSEDGPASDGKGCRSANPDGDYLAVRPSGTEPKIKFYLFAYEPAEQIGDLAETKAAVAERLQALQTALSALANEV